jgi:hypothetical protein
MTRLELTPNLTPNLVLYISETPWQCLRSLKILQHRFPGLPRNFCNEDVPRRDEGEKLRHDTAILASQ